MNIVTIPKKLAGKDDLVVIPRREYEEFLALKKIIPIAKITQEELRTLRRGEKEIQKGQHSPWLKIKHELARRHN